MLCARGQLAVPRGCGDDTFPGRRSKPHPAIPGTAVCAAGEIAGLTAGQP